MGGQGSVLISLMPAFLPDMCSELAHDLGGAAGPLQARLCYLRLLGRPCVGLSRCRLTGEWPQHCPLNGLGLGGLWNVRGCMLGSRLWAEPLQACRCAVDSAPPPAPSTVPTLIGACAHLQDVGLLEYQHHPRDYASHLSPGSIIQPQRRRPSLLSEFQPGNER